MISRLLTAVIFPIALGYSIGGYFTGCAALQGDLSRVNSNTSADGDVLSKCRGEARTVFYGDGGTKNEALDAYHACLQRSGL